MAPPRANWSWAWTVTVPAVDGRVRVTEATPDELVVAMTLAPDVVPFDRVPAEVVNRMPAPMATPPDWPGARVTVSA